MNYYNELDPYAVAWLQNLIDADHLTQGVVDSRSINDLELDAARGFTWSHFFAGIGGWDLALQMAGWPKDREVMTGSAPCQPWSAAGKQKGVNDDRHLWPYWCRIIDRCRPAVIFGEQVSSTGGREWLTGVRLDLEAMGYAIWAIDTCAPSVGAPHIRQRLYWVAYTKGKQARDERQSRICPINSTVAGVGDSDIHDSFWWDGPVQVGWNAISGEVERSGRKYRAQWRLKPGLSILADGIPARMARCRAFGNAVVPQVAAKFIRAFLDVERDQWR